jgi:hypothetical protein
MGLLILQHPVRLIAGHLEQQLLLPSREVMK